MSEFCRCHYESGPASQVRPSGVALLICVFFRSRHHTKRQRTSDSPEKIEANNQSEDGTDKGSSSHRKSRNGRAVAPSTTPALPATQSSSKRSSGRNRGSDKEHRRDGTDTPTTQVTLITHADNITESEQSEEPPRSARLVPATVTKPEEPIPTISTPSLEVPDTPSMTNKRASRNSRRRGNNRNANRASEDPGESSSHAMARDVSAQGTDANGVHDRPAKPRIPNSRTTIQEMRRRVNGISDFILKTQVEIAQHKQRSNVFGALMDATLPNGNINGDTFITVLNNNGTGATNSSISTPTSASASTSLDKVTVVTDKPEAEAPLADPFVLPTPDLMDFLMKRVHHWELTYNRQPERVM